MAKTRVMIVENDAMDAGALSDLLTKNDYEIVGIADTEAEAARLFKDKSPDIVLMDIMLADDQEGGIKAAKQIHRFGGATVIYLSGATPSKELYAKINDSRHFAFLVKPLVPAQVLATLNLCVVKAQGRRVVFQCYSHLDARFQSELDGYLKPLAKLGVDAWSDNLIKYGEQWREQIARAISLADAAIFLVSTNFMNSRFIQDFEVPKLVGEKGVPVYSVYVGGVADKVLDDSGLNEFQAINAPTDPVNQWDRKKREKLAWIPLCNFLTEGI